MASLVLWKICHEWPVFTSFLKSQLFHKLLGYFEGISLNIGLEI